MTKVLNIYKKDGTLIASGAGTIDDPVVLKGLPKGSYFQGTYYGAWVDGNRSSNKLVVPSFNKS